MTSNRQIVALSLLVGALAAIATFKGGALIADVGLLVIVGLVRRRPPPWIWLIAVPIAMTSIWAVTWWVPLWTALRVLMLGTVFAAWRPRLSMLSLGFTAVLLVQTAGLLFVFDYPRANGYTDNASVLGQLGLTAFMLAGAGGTAGNLLGVVGSVSLAASVARAALLATVIYVTTHPNRYSLGFGGITLVLLTAHLIVAGGADRLSVDSMKAQLVARGQLNNGEGMARYEFLENRAKREHITVAEADALYPQRPPRFTWRGYGYDSYVDNTNTIRPHTIPTLIVYEMGIFSLPIFGVIIWAFWRRKLPLKFALVLLPLWLVTEEQWSRPAAHYMLVLMAVAALHQQKQKTAGDYVRAKWVRFRVWAAQVYNNRRGTPGDQGQPHQRPAK